MICEPTHPLSQPTRLAIMIILVSRGKIVFSTLQKILQLTPGNIDSHTKRLERAGYVKIKKGFVGGAPRTVIVITDEGYHSTMLYIFRLKRALDDVIKQHSYPLGSRNITLNLNSTRDSF
ncbi:MAG: transcriptional regulator [Candidatus Thermoplasmatota archaeon]